AGDEVDVAAKPIELGDDDGAAPLARRGQGGGQLRPALERVGPLAGFHLNELLSELVALGLGESLDRRFLRLEPEAGAALPARRDPVVSQGLHWFLRS